MPYKVTEDIIIENAHLLPGAFKNFSGRPDKYNRAGSRSFCVAIDDENLAKKLIDDGWNIRILAPRDEDESPRYYIQVQVSFENKPPRIVMLTGRNRTNLDEESVDCLDYAEMLNVDLTISPYNWEVNGKTGVKAYLRNMYVTIREDRLAEKYAEDNVPF